MLTIVKNAETAFLEHLGALYETSPASRCLYLRSSKIEEEKNNWLPAFLLGLEQSLNGESGQAYLCADGDLFITARSLTQKSASAQLLKLIDKLGMQEDGQLSDLFEIGISRDRLEALCNKKIENLGKKNSPEKDTTSDTASKGTNEILVNKIDKNMLSSIPKRRADRTKPEVMVVEDDIFSQKLVNHALNGKYAVNMSEDGQGALLSYVSKAPDVLFLDIGLPDIDGLKVLEHIFNIDPNAYVVMFSGNGNKENIMKAVELGACGFLGKPFTSDKLIQYIEKSPYIQAKQKKDVTHGHPIH